MLALLALAFRAKMKAIMEQTPKQQIIDLIKKSKNILVFSHENPDGDAIGSSLALTLALNKLGKSTSFVCADTISDTFKFLPHLDKIIAEPKAGDQFTITLDTADAKITKLGYKNYPTDNKLKIVIETKNSQLTKDQVSFEGGAKPDLIIVLDSSEIERIGRLYEEHTALFYETPVVNIDHHPGNDNFGKVNWVDLTATSTAEIMVSLIESLSSIASQDKKSPVNLIDEDIATLLLTGLTTDTGSFQNTNTTPKAFTVAAQLVAAGARQQEIVKNIYKTKKFTTLKLWGKALERLRLESENRFAWAYLTKGDFSLIGAGESENAGVIDELLKSVPDIDFALLLTEKKGSLYGSLRSTQPKTSVEEIAKIFGGGGHKMAAAFKLENGSFEKDSLGIIDQIKDFQQKRYAQENNLEPTSSNIDSYLPDYV